MDKISSNESIVRKNIGVDNPNQQPTVRVVGNVESDSSPYQEVAKTIDRLTHQVYPILADHGLKNMSGTGWERVVSEPDFGVMKFGFDESAPLGKVWLADNKISQNIVFTGRQLCDLATYAASKVVQSKHQNLNLEWMTLKTNTMEGQKGPTVSHHVLIIGSPNVDYKYFLDMTYGQVKNGEGVLLAPLKTLKEWYPELTDEKTVPINIAWNNYESRLNDDIELRKATEKVVASIS